MWGEIPHNLINTVCFFEQTRVYPPLLCTLGMEQMCIKEFDSEMRYDCRCEKCRLESSYEKVELRLSVLNIVRTRIGQQYSNYLGKIYDKVGVKAWRIKIDSNYDEKTKKLYSKMKDLDKRANAQIYRLNSLERKLDLINEDEYYSQQYA